MSTTQASPRTAEQFAVPDDLTAAESKLVYVAVSVSGGATIDDLQSSLNLNKITLFPVLDALSERGLIDRVGSEYVPAAA
jgi:DNA-binding MarR family transcriptional regulator